MGDIDGEAQGGIAMGHGAFDMIVDPSVVAAHVELEHAKAVGRRPRDRLEARIADRAEHVGDAELFSRFDHRRGPAGGETLQRADRAEHDRQPQPAPQHLGRGIDLIHVAQYARPQCEAIERHAIAPQRGLGFRAADDVVPIVLIEILPGLGDKLVQVQEFGRRRGVAQRCRFLEAFLVHLGAGILC
jgi:hypothetical protein